MNRLLVRVFAISVALVSVTRPCLAQSEDFDRVEKALRERIAAASAFQFAHAHVYELKVTWGHTEYTAEQIEAMRREVEGKPEHPKRAEL